MPLLLLDPRNEAVLVNQHPSANANDCRIQFIVSRTEEQPSQAAFAEGWISSRKLLDGEDARKTRLMNRRVAFRCGAACDVAS
jgi:hypothetical protein